MAWIISIHVLIDCNRVREMAWANGPSSGDRSPHIFHLIHLRSPGSSASELYNKALSVLASITSHSRISSKMKAIIDLILSLNNFNFTTLVTWKCHSRFSHPYPWGWNFCSESEGPEKGVWTKQCSQWKSWKWNADNKPVEKANANAKSWKRLCRTWSIEYKLYYIWDDILTLWEWWGRNFHYWSSHKKVHVQRVETTSS